MNKSDKIYVAGHTGMVGSAIVMKLKQEGFSNFVLKTHSELDLIRQQEVEDFFSAEKPDYVFLAAARVGGIHANNTFKADFIYENLMIESNVINSAAENGVRKLLFLGSSCIYPKFAHQPIKEDYLLDGKLEPTNEPYAVAKIAGIKLCQSYREQKNCDFISIMPTNLYGPNDNFDLQNSHVLPALIRKFHEAKEDGNKSVEIWGSGTPKREFLHVHDLADACYFLMRNYSSQEIVNVGTGEDISIIDLAKTIQKIVGYEGEIHLNRDYPDGTPRKLLDVSKIHEMGWKHSISLEKGIESVYQEFKRSLTHA